MQPDPVSLRLDLIAGSARVCDSIDTTALVVLLRDDVEPVLLLQRAGDSTAYRVRLPLQGFDDLVDRRSLCPAQHRNELRLLAVLAGRLRPLGFGFLRARIRFGLDVGRCLICGIGNRIFRLVAQVDAERGECGLGGNERHAAALLVVPPDGGVALVSRPMLELVLNDCVTDTNETVWASNSS